MEHAAATQEDQLDSDFLPDGTSLLNGQYVIERYLSSGGFGITYLARDSLDRPVVIKECFPEAFCSRKNRTVVARTRSQQHEFQSFVDMFVREAKSIAKLNHPNIVGVHQVFQDNETAYMALDLIDGTDLLDIIEAGGGRPSYPKAKANLLKLLDAISMVHGQDMLHRDISPDNILIDAWENPILIDFGAAREEASKKSRALSAVLVVKDGYSPQEFYISGSKQTASSDLYALAATFYHLITGEMPPDSQSRLAAIASRKADPYLSLKNRVPDYPAEFLEAIDICMNVFPQDRLQTAQEWILRIDAERRTAVARERALSDQDIERTVTQLIEAAQKNAPKEATISESREEPPEIPLGRRHTTLVLSKNDHRAPAWEVVDDPVGKPGLWKVKPYRPSDIKTGAEQPKRYLKLQEGQSVTRRKSRKRRRTAARLVLCGSLCLLAASGQAKPVTEVLEPIFLQVISSAEKFFTGIG